MSEFTPKRLLDMWHSLIVPLSAKPVSGELGKLIVVCVPRPDLDDLSKSWESQRERIAVLEAIVRAALAVDEWIIPQIDEDNGCPLCTGASVDYPSHMNDCPVPLLHQALHSTQEEGGDGE